jgi:hypothetical protein
LDIRGIEMCGYADNFVLRLKTLYVTLCEGGIELSTSAIESFWTDVKTMLNRYKYFLISILGCISNDISCFLFATASKMVLGAHP